MERCGGVNFEKIVNTSPVTSFVWFPSEPEKPCFVSGGIRALGYAPEDFTSGRLRYIDLVHPDDQASLSLSPGVEPQIYRALDADGEWRWIFHRICTLGGEEGSQEEILWNISDITYYKNAQEDLRKSEARLKAFLKAVPALILILDEDGRYVEVSGSNEASVFEDTSEVIGKRLYELFPEEKATELMAPLIRCIETGAPQFFRYDLGESPKRYFEARISLLPDSIDGKKLVICVVLDITAKRELEDEISLQAAHDPLGGSFNRTHFNRALLMALADAQRTESTLALFLLDMDRFRMVNEAIGREMADLLLRGIGQRLKKTSRQDDTIYRMEGTDYYYLILPKPGTKENVASVAERFLEAVKSASEGYSGSFTLSATIGISIFPENGGDAKTLLRAAESALSAGKAEGGSRYRFAGSSAE